MKTIYIIQENNSPSTDYFLSTLLKQQDADVRYFSHEDALPDDKPNASIVFVRYIPKHWQKWIDVNLNRIADVILFLDDDLFDLKSYDGLPWHYQWKLFKFTYTKQRWLKKIKAKLWVSTPYLQEKYQAWQPKLIEPLPIQAKQQEQLCLFYHGSSSHQAEIDWLYAVMEQVLQENEQVVFEIIGNLEINQVFRNLPRTYIVHPMDWTSYLAFSERSRQIGLAPLLERDFNQARSYTKFFDITRANAVGIYAKHPVYEAIVEHQVNGLLVEMEQQAWVTQINALIHDVNVRQQIAARAQAQCARMIEA